MRHLYELTFNHKDSIVSKVSSLCERDAYVKSLWNNEELKQSIIHFFSGIILSLFENSDITAEKDIILQPSLSMSNITSTVTCSLIMSGTSISTLICVLRHFKNCINELIFLKTEDRETLYRYMEMNERCYHKIELALLKYWKDIETENAPLKKIIDNECTEREEKYKSFFNLSPDMIYVIEMKEMCIKEANPLMLNTLGVTLEQLKQMKMQDLIIGDVFDDLKGVNEALMQGYDVKGLRLKVRGANESILELEVNCAPIFEGSEVTKVLCLARNNTELYKVEELKKQAEKSIELLNEVIENDKVKTEFFSNLSHELRTPLNVILGTLQLVDMYSNQSCEDVLEKIKKYHKIMRQNCYRLLRLVNNLIDLNKLDSGYMNLNVGNYDIVGIVTQISESVTDYAANKGIDFTYYSKTSSRVIACDPDKIERILLNLLSNSIKFTPIGGKIQVQLWDENECVYISVKDTGVGIPKNKQDLVFRRFAQIDQSLSRNFQGSGIGLSLVKSLVELHGGKVRMISDAGAGCEFIIELPARQIEVMEPGSKDSQYNSNNKIEVINIEFADIYS